MCLTLFRAAEFKAAKAQNKQHPMYQTSAHSIGTVPKGAKAAKTGPNNARPHSFTKVRKLQASVWQPVPTR